MVVTTPQAPPPQRRRTSLFRSGAGLLLVVVAGYVLVTKAGTLLAGHPAYPTLLIATVVTGLILVVTGLRPSRSRSSSGGVGLVIARVLGVVGTVLLLAGIVYLIPLPATDPSSAMQSSAAVTVAGSPTRIVLTPAGGPTPRAGLVFQPGAKVDPRAYVALLKPVAQAGYLVVIVKQPFNIGFASIGDPGNVIAGNPGVTRWAVAGHSLGGVAAGSYADQHDPLVRGLLFWASYPLGSLASRTDLVVTSVSGTNDGLSTPADIEASRAKLPSSATFVAVQGGVHAFFGDYGEQPGDGTPSVSREVAQQQIVAATVAFMGKVAA